MPFSFKLIINLTMTTSFKTRTLIILHIISILSITKENPTLTTTSTCLP